jgi:hypothetical protein
MWPFTKKEHPKKVSPEAAIAIILAFVALGLAAGTARWAWLLLDEQIALRMEFNRLADRMGQLETQFEFWNGQVQEERAMLKDEMKKLQPGE